MLSLWMPHPRWSLVTRRVPSCLCWWHLRPVKVGSGSLCEEAGAAEGPRIPLWSACQEEEFGSLPSALVLSPPGAAACFLTWASGLQWAKSGPVLSLLSLEDKAEDGGWKDGGRSSLSKQDFAQPSLGLQGLGKPNSPAWRPAPWEQLACSISVSWGTLRWKGVWGEVVYLQVSLPLGRRGKSLPWSRKHGREWMSVILGPDGMTPPRGPQSCSLTNG